MTHVTRTSAESALTDSIANIDRAGRNLEDARENITTARSRYRRAEHDNTDLDATLLALQDQITAALATLSDIHRLAQKTLELP